VRRDGNGNAGHLSPLPLHPPLFPYHTLRISFSIILVVKSPVSFIFISYTNSVGEISVLVKCDSKVSSNREGKQE
jgi:hypothetical protein